MEIYVNNNTNFYNKKINSTKIKNVINSFERILKIKIKDSSINQNEKLNNKIYML